MGVPSFYKWLTEKYPKIICTNYLLENNNSGNGNGNENENGNVNGEKKKIRFNNLYIDMNGVIHNSTHPKNASSLSPIDSDDVCRMNLLKHLDELVAAVSPTNLLYIAMDGVPPRAKAIEQRKRRFRSAKDAKDALAKRTPNDPVFEPFDSNCISPATEFMCKVNEWVLCYAQALVKRMPSVSIVVSDASVPGEGEHKIMDFIRAHRQHWPSDTSHVFYGMDADLIFLGLSTQLSHFFVLRDLGAQIFCTTCKNNGHLTYECGCAVAKKRLNDPDCCNRLSVRNIPIQADEKYLYTFFGRFGKVLSIRLERAMTKRPSLNALVEMESAESAKSIVSNGANYFINDMKLSFQYAVEKDKEKEKVSASASASPATGSPTLSSEQDVSDTQPVKAIFIPNLDCRTLMFDVTSFFSRCGTIEEATFIKSPKDPKIKFAVIRFADEEQCKRALDMNGIDFYGTSLIIRKSRPMTKEPKAPLSDEQKKQQEQSKEEKKLQKLEIVNTFLTKADPGTNLDTAYFYLGLSEWNIDKAFETYLAYGKSQHKLASITPNLRDEDTFDFVNLDYMKEYFKYSVVSGLPESLASRVDCNRVINDFTMMCMLLGNDFLPHLPTMAIKEGSIELMMSWYKDWLISFNNSESTPIQYVTDGPNINFKPLYHLLSMLSKWEKVYFPDKLEKMHRKEVFRLDNLLAISPHLEPQRRNLDGEINYYRLKIGVASDKVESTANSLCKAFLDGLTWVLRYYTVGCPAWGWYYPFHYAPLTSDLCKYVQQQSLAHADSSHIKFEFGQPLEPFIHLLSVLPRYSSKLLPPKIAESVVLEPSPISRVFEERFRIDPNGEEVSWKGVVLLDFINTDLLKEHAAKVELTAEELERNKFGKDKYVRFNCEIMDFDQHLDVVKQQSSSREKDKHKQEIESHYHPLTATDLLWADRKFYTLDPTTPESYETLPLSLPMINPPTSTLPTEVVISDEQHQFLEWRDKQSQVEGSLEALMSSIDLKQTFTVGVNNKESTPIERILSNEISKSKQIQMISISDQQMIVHIQFNQQVKLKGLKLISTISKESIPKVVKVYFNQTSVDFSSLESLNPAFRFELDESMCGLITDYLSFGQSKVHQSNSITIFVESNHGTTDETLSILEKIILI